MKQIINKNNNKHNLKDLIKKPLTFIDKANRDYDKKSLEICHTSKFLKLLNRNLYIYIVGERPDFILETDNQNYIGLEHEVLIDYEAKEKEGAFKDLIKSVETAFKINHPDEKIHVNVVVNPDFKFRKKDKSSLVDRLSSMIEHCVYNDRFIENDLVRRLSWSKHTGLDFTCNLGAWFQKSLKSSQIIDSIKKKEEKRLEYISNTGITDQWLLIVVGSLGESSFIVDSRLDYDFIVETGFDKVFLMEDLNSILFEIK